MIPQRCHLFFSVQAVIWVVPFVGTPTMITSIQSNSFLLQIYYILLYNRYVL